MTDKVQKIREEIERLLEQAAVTDYWRGYDKALKYILFFIDSMQEEPRPKFKVGDTIANGEDTLTIEQVMEDYYIVYNENTENDANQVIWELKFKDQDNWKLIRKPVSEELEEASRRYVTPPNALGIRTFKAGAQWQKEQIMKDSIKCEITWMDGFMLDYTQEQQDDLLEKIGAKVGDKVKLVIIKED